jgi:hypothetical protein
MSAHPGSQRVVLPPVRSGSAGEGPMWQDRATRVEGTDATRDRGAPEGRDDVVITRDRILLDRSSHHNRPHTPARTELARAAQCSLPYDARGESRTRTPLRARDFESRVSAIPPLGLAAVCLVPFGAAGPVPERTDCANLVAMRRIPACACPVNLSTMPVLATIAPGKQGRPAHEHPPPGAEPESGGALRLTGGREPPARLKVSGDEPCHA